MSRIQDSGFKNQGQDQEKPEFRIPGHEFYRKRRSADARFRYYGMAAVGFSLLLLVLLLGSLFWRGMGGFTRAEITLDVPQIQKGDTQAALRSALRAQFPEVNTKEEKRDLYTLLSIGAPYVLQEHLSPHLTRDTRRPLPVGEVTIRVPASDAVNLWLKNQLSPEAVKQRLNNRQLAMLQKLKADDKLALHFNWDFFSAGDSREPELAGFAAGIIGSLWTVLVCLAVAFPLGVATAVYLEEFAPRHWFNELIEVNINNLAAVPSIVFGLLGLAVYLNFFGLPRSSALVGGMTLAMLVLPVIIIATRAALRAVPPSIRDAARGLGASELQVVQHHVLPLALPGILTGVILAIARALGETAPLLMIGMVAFIADIPQLPLDPATVMPVQIYLWASSPEIGFIEKTAAAILVLLAILLLMNLIAIILRNRFERRW